MFRLLHILVFTSLSLVSSAADEENRRHAVFQKKRVDLLLNLQHEISTVAKRYRDGGETTAADILTAASESLSTPFSGFVPPRFIAPDNTPAQRWSAELKRLQTDGAQQMYVLARQTLRAKFPSLAYSMINDVLRIDSDHRLARSVIGHQMFRDPLLRDDRKYAGEWVTAFEARKRSGRAPEILHARFGWIPRAQVERYEGGERLYRGRWVSAEKEQELRRDFSNAWEIQSEHFLVKTNTSLEEGVEISQKLETFHRWLRTHMAGFFDTPAELQRRFEQTGVRFRRTADPMEVHYYATKEEYQKRMVGKIPPNQDTNGLYWDADKTCYFFRNDKVNAKGTVFHEATHQILDLATKSQRVSAARRRQQLLRERTLRPWRICEKSNFWIIEGLACYFESFEIAEDGSCSVGRPDHIRFVGAQHRLLVNSFFVPFRNFMALGHEQFMTHPNRRQFYTQASGVAHFLMSYQEGLYRDDLVQLLSAVYRPTVEEIRREPSIARISGVDFAVLDQQYRDHMQDLQDQVSEQTLNDQ